ncbi:hypothetical protein [Methylorubrum suomiense]|uniref:Uncharacterized protein n=1 Tax=Methylorubrum suomiense TaxID=144191 RepID=A0ABQ4V382_9HYPH|nr:hypothetical protein [Methylorubrum suomiense]GJE78098.1 hypothetical protein BGCPKDLD_4709 [Methylorubrum suomiense]
MAKRLSHRPNFFKISRPGVDVDTAAEKDLLISLGARNAQIIQRGFIPLSAGTETRGNTPATSGLSTWVFNVPFPAQATEPDFYCIMLERNNLDTSKQNQAFPPTQDVVFGKNSVQITFYGSNGGFSGSRTYVGLIYILLRKRLGS